MAYFKENESVVRGYEELTTDRKKQKYINNLDDEQYAMFYLEEVIIKLLESSKYDKLTYTCRGWTCYLRELDEEGPGRSVLQAIAWFLKNKEGSPFKCEVGPAPLRRDDRIFSSGDEFVFSRK